MEIDHHDQFAILGHPQRLAVFRMLMRRFPDALPAGEIAAATGIKPSTLSVYLSALRGAGLIRQDRVGTSLRYTADVDRASGLVEFMFADCCRGRPALCNPAPVAGTDRVMNVMFLCTGNSARSIFAEALLRDLGQGRFNAFSAGTTPARDVHLVAGELLRDKGHDTTGLHPKTVEDLMATGAPEMDFVFTVCDRAANEDCPAWPGLPVTAHWGIPDPVTATGTRAERMLAFQQAYGALKSRISAFVALPFETLDRSALQQRLDGLSHLQDTL
jgi:arsenate reductase